MKLVGDYSSTVYESLERLLAVEKSGLEARLRTMFQPYESFSIPKGQGPARLIEAPCAELKELQRRILDSLLYRIPIPADCHGFVPGRSIVTHARLHRNQRQLLNFDIASAFPSVSRARVLSALERRLGAYLKHRAPRLDRSQRNDLLALLADLTTWNDHLPQGAPSSGALLNLVLAPLDRRMRKELRRWKRRAFHGLVYSRYADDLNLSSAETLPHDAEEVLRRAIHQAGFRFNARKTRRADRARGQVLDVCGIHVDGEALRLPGKTLRRYRAILHRSFHAESLSTEQRGLIHGIAGLVHMVYGCWPSQLGRSWQLLAARHALVEPSLIGPERTSGYSARC